MQEQRDILQEQRVSKKYWMFNLICPCDLAQYMYYNSILM